MNEVWKRIFKDYIECYNGINKLDGCVIDGDEADKLKVKLLENIIETFKSEVED